MNSEKEHTWLIRGISASIGLTLFLAGWLWFGLTEVSNDVDTILSDIGYIKGVISQWESYPP